MGGSAPLFAWGITGKVAARELHGEDWAAVINATVVYNSAPETMRSMVRELIADVPTVSVAS